MNLIFHEMFLYGLNFVTHCCSVAMSCPILCDPMDWNMPDSPVLRFTSRGLLKLMFTESVMLCNHLLLCRRLLLLALIFPRIRVFGKHKDIVKPLSGMKGTARCCLGSSLR